MGHLEHGTRYQERRGTAAKPQRTAESLGAVPGRVRRVRRHTTEQGSRGPEVVGSDQRDGAGVTRAATAAVRPVRAREKPGQSAESGTTTALSSADVKAATARVEEMTGFDHYNKAAAVERYQGHCATDEARRAMRQLDGMARTQFGGRTLRQEVDRRHRAATPVGEGAKPTPRDARLEKLRFQHEVLAEMRGHAGGDTTATTLLDYADARTTLETKANIVPQVRW